MAYAGLRKDELLSLTWDNVSLDDNNSYIKITTNKKFRPKGGKTNTIRLTSQALDILKAQKGKNATYIFHPKQEVNYVKLNQMRFLK